MHPKIKVLFGELKTLAIAHTTIRSVQIRGEEITANRGYLSMRLVLRSHDIVEVFVYLINEDEALRLVDYSLHWQGRDGALIKRWDSAPHHPEIDAFPHHIHKADGNVESGNAFDWESVMAILKHDILGDN